MLYVCERCTKIFESEAHNARLCQRCREGVRYYRPTPLRSRKCAKCGDEFQTRRSDKKFCSVKCLRAFHDKRRWRKKRCPWCEKEFETTRGMRDYCCREHYVLAKNKRDLVRIRRDREWAKRLRDAST